MITRPPRRDGACAEVECRPCRHPVGKHKNKPDIYLIRSIKLTMGFSKPKAKNFRMQGVSSTGSTLLGLFFPNTKVPSRATIIVMEAPKVVYHIYEIR